MKKPQKGKNKFSKKNQNPFSELHSISQKIKRTTKRKNKIKDTRGLRQE
jgi:hypothetical protein